MEDKRVFIVAAILLVVVMGMIFLTGKYIIRDGDDMGSEFDDFGGDDIHNTDPVDDLDDGEDLDVGDSDVADDVDKPGNEVIEDDDSEKLPARGNLDSDTVTNLVNAGVEVNEDGSIEIDYSFNVLGQLRNVAKYTDSKDFKYIYGTLPSEEEYLLVYEFESCGMCREYLPNLFMYNNTEGVEGVVPVYILDIDEENNRGLIEEYGVKETPTTIHFKGGVEVGRVVGRKTPEELMEFVKSN